VAYSETSPAVRGRYEVRFVSATKRSIDMFRLLAYSAFRLDGARFSTLECFLLVGRLSGVPITLV